MPVFIIRRADSIYGEIEIVTFALAFLVGWQTWPEDGGERFFFLTFPFQTWPEDFFPSYFLLQTGLRNRMIEVVAVEDNGFFPQHSLAAHGVALISFEITY